MLPLILIFLHQRGRELGPGISLGTTGGTGGGGKGASSATTSNVLSESELSESGSISRDGELDITMGHCQQNTEKTQ